MYHKKTEEDIRCPLEYGIRLLDGKWKSRIVCELGNIGSMHFGELKSDLVNISDGVLAKTLNELADMDILIKEADGELKGTICYRLTEKGFSLLPLLRELCRWSAPYYQESSKAVMGHCLQCDFYKQWEKNLGKKNL